MQNFSTYELSILRKGLDAYARDARLRYEEEMREVGMLTEKLDRAAALEFERRAAEFTEREDPW